MDHSQRKQDHLNICLHEDVSSGLATGLSAVRLRHMALPEIDLSHVCTQSAFLGRQLAAPLLISSMTGGGAQSARINENLARAAQSCGVALALGSGRVALGDAAALPSFQVRRFCPDVPLYANLGAVQLNKGVSAADCGWLVEALEADGLVLHLNPLQEALQPGGDTVFAGLLERIRELCQSASFPIIVKEVGWGLSGEVAHALASVGVAALDVAGAGGTSWSEVERRRSGDDVLADVAAPFRDWGLTTAESLVATRSACPDLPVVASGGICSGVDAAKALALGANLVGLGAALLPAAADSATAVERALAVCQAQLKTAMFAVGAQRISQLDKTVLWQAPHG
jgi:isopentenyl-diphosphate delta-isomerase